jgi:hypothetical protein
MLLELNAKVRVGSRNTVLFAVVVTHRVLVFNFMHVFLHFYIF